MPYASLAEAYAPLVPDGNKASNAASLPKTMAPMNRPSSSLELVQANSTFGLPEAPAVEKTIEFEKANEHIKNTTFSPNLPRTPVTYRKMDDYEDIMMRIRNSPELLEYIKEVIKSESPNTNANANVKESFLNMFDRGEEADPLIDLIVIIGIGILIIFVLDSFVRLGKSLRG